LIWFLRIIYRATHKQINKMATIEIPIIDELNEQDVMRKRQEIKHLPKEQQIELLEESFKKLREKLNGIPIEALVEKNPHLKELLERKIIPQPNEISDAFERLLNEKPTYPLMINDVEYQLKRGITTPPNSYYKNGWKIHDVKGDGKFKQLNIYTARHNAVDYEHRIMFKKTKKNEWKLVVLEGFDGIDLLKVDTLGNSEVYVLDYLNVLLKRV